MSGQSYDSDGREKRAQKDSGSSDEPPRLPAHPTAERTNVISADSRQGHRVVAIHPDFGKKIRDAASSAHERPSPSKVDIRWMVNSDMQRVLAIDAESCRESWNESRWRTALKGQNTIGMVTEIGEQVVGAFIYDIHKDHIRLQKLVISQDFRRQGIGFAAVKRLLDKLKDTREELLAVVPAGNLIAHQFLRACGFWASLRDSDNRGIRLDDEYLFRALHGEIKELRAGTAKKGAPFGFLTFSREPK